MKYTTLILLLMINLCTLYAQVSLEKTYSTTSNTTITYTLIDVHNDLYGSELTHYILFNSSSNTMEIINTDYSLHKTITIPPQNNYKIANIWMASKKVFNNDDLIEFLVIATNSEQGIKYSTKLYNENGDELYDFGNVNYPTIYIANNSYKLRTSTFDMQAPYDYEIKIYSLSGTVTKNSFTSYENNRPSPFPNPANSVINLPYSIESGHQSIMNIFDISGNLIEQKKLSPYLNNIVLNISNYKKGSYLYIYNGLTKKFIVQ